MTTPVAAAWPSSLLPGRLARLLLTLPFWWSGVAKLLDFPSALAEVDHFGLHPPLLYAALVIAVQLGGSILLVAGAWPWLAAGALAAFTLAASVMGHAFWNLPDPQARFHDMNAFLANLGLIGGLALGAMTARAAGRR
ncbi:MULTISPECIES: DoxX family protein [Achromobacter]|uniref:DoxX family protein n=1 Tax=Achromobacter denitrificans TaxID=32002 RepID=A0A6N0JPY4_ACHDE|nr:MULTISPECIES: DoxX family protein [Achromobacter]MDF3848859.1 DoxX family protein [Achromobacter denitrificans]QKQ49203.1 DoxX family protein [Achromobacter denitrificans]